MSDRQEGEEVRVEAEQVEGEAGEKAEETEAADTESDAHRWSSPFGELQEMMEDLVDGFRGFSPAAYVRYPRMEMVEAADSYQVLMDVPGVARDDLSVSALGDELTVTGQKRRPAHPEGSTVRRSERSYGRFRRVVRLPADVDTDGIRARLEAGVLRVTLPRRVGTAGRTIDVEAE